MTTKNHKLTNLLAAGAALVFAAAPVGAQVTYTWDADNGTGGNQDGGGTWQLGQPNWDADGTPNQNWADNNDAVIGVGSGAAAPITVSGTVNANSLTLDQPGSGNYTISGGTIDVHETGGITVNATGTTTISSKVTNSTPDDHKSTTVNTVDADTTLILSGGTGGDPMLWNSGLTHSGLGTLTLSGTSEFGKSGLNNGPGISLGHAANPAEGRTLNISGDVTLADRATFGLGFYNNLNLTGSLTTSGSQHTNVEGTLTLSGNAQMLFQGDGINWLTDGDGQAVLNIQDDAVFEVDRTAGENSTNFWSPGGLNLCAGWNSPTSPGNPGTGTVNQDGGTVNLPVTVAPGLGFGGAVGGQGLLLGGMRSDPNGGPIVATYNLNDGLLYTSGVYNLSGLWTGDVIDDPANYNHTAIFNFNGGLLRASQSDSTDPGVVAQGNNHFMGNLTHAYVKSGGANVDSNGFDISIDQSLEHDPALGNTRDGGLTKLGSGTLTLLQAGTYTGDTNVNVGVLKLQHGCLYDASTVSIAGGASMFLNFFGIDTIGGLTLGGVAQPAGVYSAASHPAFLSGTGALLVGGSSLKIAQSGADFLLTWASAVGLSYNVLGSPGLPPTNAFPWPIYDGNSGIFHNADEGTGDDDGDPNMTTARVDHPSLADYFFAIAGYATPEQCAFEDNFDGADMGWVAGGSVGDGPTNWVEGTPGAPGPAAANSAPDCWGTNLAADYGDNADITLTSPSIDLTNATTAVLRFAEWSIIDNLGIGGDDAGSIEVLDADNADALLATIRSNTSDTAGWESGGAQELSLTPYVGGNIKIRFRFVTGPDGFIAAGWYIDDVKVAFTPAS